MAGHATPSQASSVRGCRASSQPRKESLLSRRCLSRRHIVRTDAGSMPLPAYRAAKHDQEPSGRWHVICKMGVLVQGLPSGHPIYVWMQSSQTTLIAALDSKLIVDLPPTLRRSLQAAMLNQCWGGSGLWAALGHRLLRHHDKGSGLSCLLIGPVRPPVVTTIECAITATRHPSAAARHDL